MSRPTARRASTASPPLQAAASTRSIAACRATTTTSRRASSKACSRPTRGALRVVSLYLPNGNPIGTEKFPYKLALDGAAGALGRRAARARGAAGARRRLQRHPRADRRQASRRSGSATRCSSRRPRQAFRRLVESRLHRRHARGHRRCAASTPSGTIRPAPGRRTTASASTT